MKITILLISLFTIIICKKHNPSNFLICSKYNCPISQGFCTRDNKCACYNGFITIVDEKYGEYQCNYEKKSQSIAFLLEFVIGFGVGHFYLGNFNLAIFKLTFCFLTAFFICFFPYFTINIKSQQLKNIVPYIQTIFGIIYCMWQVADGLLIGLSIYKDGNNIDMNEW